MLLRINNLIINLFSPRSKATVCVISLILLAFLGYLDFVTGEYSLIVFYLVPVSLVAWFVSRSSGLVFCIIALITRLIADQAMTSFRFSYTPLHYWNVIIEIVFLFIMSLLFSLLRSNLEKEKTLASTDSLTAALNRRSFFDLAEYEMNRLRRYKLPLTVAYIDLDDFKTINDRLGHYTGDNLLVTVVKTITSNIRSTDIIARFGGDEFVLMLPETHADAAKTFLDKLRTSMQEAMNSNNWGVSFSIGAVSYKTLPDSVEEVIRQADALMYEVKRSGKNRLLLKEYGEVTNG